MRALRPLTLTVLFLATLSACGDSRTEYRFFLDDEPIEPEILALVGEPGAPAAGDVALVDRFAFVLGEGGDHRLFTVSRAQRRSLRELDDGSRVRWTWSLGRGDDEPSADPEDWRHVRGLVLWGGWAEHAAVLDHVSLRDCLVTQNANADAPVFTDLPADARYLDLGSRRVGELPSDVALPDLRLLVLPKWDWDALWESEYPDPEESRPEQALGWIAELRDLRRLDLSGSAVRDLSPLGGHEKLRYLRADDAPIELLPRTPLPDLRRLDAVEWPRADEEIERFRSMQPRTRVVVGPTERLRDLVSEAVGVRLHRSPPAARDGGAVEPKYASDDAREVAELLEMLVIQDSYSSIGYSVPAGGMVWIEFVDDGGRSLGILELITCDLVRAPALIGPLMKHVEPERSLEVRDWFRERGFEIGCR